MKTPFKLILFFYRITLRITSLCKPQRTSVLLGAAASCPKCGDPASDPMSDRYYRNGNKYMLSHNLPGGFLLGFRYHIAENREND